MADTKSREGKVIGGKRRCGKTTELIKRSHKDRTYILCPNNIVARTTFNQAKEMGLDIPYPITLHELPLKEGSVDEVLIDEVEIVLQRLIGKRIVGMSTSMPMEELPDISNNKPSMTIKPSREVRPKSVGELTIDVDCSEALKGLKAIQREARKATQALKELEKQKNIASSKQQKITCSKCGNEVQVEVMVEIDTGQTFQKISCSECNDYVHREQ